LNNPVQIAAVGSHVDVNMLILAGPGSGKTTVIVHRCAYLLLVGRIPARQILVLCFNHNAAVSLRKQLNALIGKPARGLTVVTYHGAAMRIAGVSVRDFVSADGPDAIDFDKIIQDALKLLKGEIEVTGSKEEEIRDQLLGGYSHILVDEYQDIDQDQYDLVAAIAGKSLAEGEGRLSILAVGDDDQNIYTFRGANVQFIRQFKKDYASKTIHLVENYRSSRHIINAANQLIKGNRDRMKGGYPIRINRDREYSDPGGRWGRMDPVARGRVQIITATDRFHQAMSILTEFGRLENLTSDFNLEACAVLSRTNEALAHVRSLLEGKYPLRLPLQKSFPLQRVREIHTLMESLKQKADGTVRASQVMQMAAGMAAGGVNVWTAMITRFLKSYADETFDAKMPTGWMLDRMYEYLAEQRREKVIGEGIFLGTVHAAKGMEFSHVFILDGDWPTPGSPRAWEEERRILYVAMTRAKENLVLMKSSEKANALIRGLKGKSILPRKSAVSPQGFADRRFYNYDTLGMSDIFIDYSGGFPPGHPIHRRLARLETGSEVTLAIENGYVEIRDGDNRCLGRLAAGAANAWRDRLDSIAKVRVLAIVRRTKNDPQENYLPYMKTKMWELPILEVVSKI
jgi:ATP-dependent DNA helicase RecQ